jgi:putative adenylate-forming enzyme
MIKKIKILKEFISVKNFYSKKKLELYQQKYLKYILLSHNSQFYPKSTRLEDFPIINKKIFMDNFDLINTINIKKDEAFNIALSSEKSRNFSNKIGDISVGLSSGTSGNRGIFLVSEDESAKWAGYILRRMLPKPWFRKHKIAFFLRANSNLYETLGSKLIEFNFYDLIKPIEEHINQLNLTQPTILIAPAQVLKLLALSKNLDIRPEKVISVAEVLEEDDENIISKRFDQKVHQIYQCTEGFLAHTCKYGHLHLNEDFVYIEKEWIDKKSGRFTPIVTNFFRTTQPVIRYKLDDILVLDPTPCECGSVFTKLKKIEGRCDDILKVKDVNNKEYLLFPDFVRRAIIQADEMIQEYKIELISDQLHIYLKPLETKKNVENALQTLYKIHNIKPLKHSYYLYVRDDLIHKRRRIKQL